MTKADIDNIMSVICPNDEDCEKPIISPAYLKKELETLALEQEQSGDLISREWLKTVIHNFYYGLKHTPTEEDIQAYIDVAPSVTQKSKIGHCKDCKYFEYDSVAKVDGVPLIVAHEICSRWGDGCKTKEDGYCFLFEPQESEVEEC